MMLSRSIDYHRAIGFDFFFVFLDGTTDDTAERLAGVADVRVQNAIGPDDPVVTEGPDWVRDIAPWWSTDMDVRKRINTHAAASEAQAMGIDWLLCIDPDEVFHASQAVPPSVCLTHDFFRDVPRRVDQVLLPNLEVVPPVASTSNPFVDCTRFLARFPVTESIWRALSAGVRRVTRAPAAQAWFDYLFYQVRFRGALPRLLVHPLTGRRIPAGYFLGYTNHKSAVRPERAQSFDFVTHHWRRWRRAPRSIRRGNVLHYDLFSFDYFVAKFRQRQESMVMKIFYVRYWLARIAREAPLQDVEAFFRRYIAFSEERVLERLERRGIVLSITSVSSLAASGVGTRTDLQKQD
jgi:hypothetical protein